MADQGSYEMALGHVLNAATSVFGRDVAAADNFFDLGGDSIVAVQLLLRLGDRLGFEPDIEDLMWSADLDSFARRLVH